MYDGINNLNQLSTASPLNGASQAELAESIRQLKAVLKNVLLQSLRPSGALRGINSGSLDPGSVGTAALIDLAILTSKIADLAITTEKLADGSVTGPKLADGAVAYGKIGANAIGTESFRDGSIPLTALAELLTGAFISFSETVDADRAITANHIKDLAVIDRAINDMALGKLTGGTAGQILVRGLSAWEAITPAGGLVYDPVTGIFSIASPVTAAYFGDLKSRGVDGGGSIASTWVTRDLGEIEDGRNLMTFTGNTFKLIPGSYFFQARCPVAGAVGKHQARLLRTKVDASLEVPLWGSSELNAASQSGHSTIQGTLEVTSEEEIYQIQHWFQNTVATTGMGQSSSSDNSTPYANHAEAYTTGHLIKLL